MIPDAGPVATEPTLRWALSFLLASSTESHPSWVPAGKYLTESPALGRVRGFNAMAPDHRARTLQKDGRYLLVQIAA